MEGTSIILKGLLKGICPLRSAILLYQFCCFCFVFTDYHVDEPPGNSIPFRPVWTVEEVFGCSLLTIKFKKENIGRLFGKIKIRVLNFNT